MAEIGTNCTEYCIPPIYFGYSCINSCIRNDEMTMRKGTAQANSI